METKELRLKLIDIVTSKHGNVVSNPEHIISQAKAYEEYITSNEQVDKMEVPTDVVKEQGFGSSLKNKNKPRK